MKTLVLYKKEQESSSANSFYRELVSFANKIGLPIDLQVYKECGTETKFPNGDSVILTSLENLKNFLKEESSFFDICFISNKISSQEASLQTENIMLIDFLKGIIE